MERQELKEQALKVWLDYEKTICKKLGFKGSKLPAEPVVEALKFDDKKLLKFIKSVQEEIARY
jgi:hypothetical protein